MINSLLKQAHVEVKELAVCVESQIASKQLALFFFALTFATIVCGDGGGTTAASPRIDWSAHKFTVVLFILHDCPICNSYAPEFGRIATEYRDRGFGFVAAYAETEFSQSDAQKHARDYHLDFSIVVDSNYDLVTKFAVKVAPEAVVCDSEGAVLYRGRIDDLYADVGQRRSAVSEHTLRDALSAIAGGGKPSQKDVPGVGCPVEVDR
jgi:thiol-disulfide isomerase/thioredoxin